MLDKTKDLSIKAQLIFLQQGEWSHKQNTPSTEANLNQSREHLDSFSKESRL